MKASKIILVLIGLAFASMANADTFLPLAKRGQIPTPTVLAERVSESLKKDPSGNGEVRGANITPNQYLQAVKTAGGTVDTVGELPTYLSNLLSTPMPTGNVQLSQVVQKPDGTRELDLKVGRYRTSFDGEQGWYDANTGKLILAGHCTNTPISLTIMIGKPSSKVEERKSPFGGNQANACPLGPVNGVVYLKPVVRASEASGNQCSKEHMLPENGLLKTGGPTSWVDSGSAFSRTCGPLLKDYHFGTKRHAIKVVLQNAGSTEDDVIFTGWLTGDKLEPAAGSESALRANGDVIIIDQVDRKGHVVLTFDDQSKMMTPTASGIGEDLANFKEGCRAMVFTAIEH